MTALGILAQARAAGLTLRPAGDKIRFKPVENMTAELKAAMVEHKQEVLALLRAGREAEVRAFYSQTFARLGALYGDDLIGNLWPAIVAQHPDLARGIDTAEQAADLAAPAHRQGTAPDSGPFLTCLQTWARAWAETIEAIAGDTCSDCGKRAVVLVGVDYGAAKYCRACLRPEPLNPKGRANACA